jgi:hypothetical protein
LEQVADIVEGKPVIGPAKDILEVKNAIVAYDELPDCNPHCSPLRYKFPKISDNYFDLRQIRVTSLTGCLLLHHFLPDLMTSYFSILVIPYLFVVPELKNPPL